MGHATAEDMIEHFENCTIDLNLRNLEQISMDGPNVNWKFHRLFQEKLTTTCDNTLISIGSCGLHIVHGAFKDGANASEWKIHNLLCSLYRLFKDTPARREDFVKATHSNVFPLKFCSHRWLENVPVANRAVEIWESISKYVKQVREKTMPNPNTASFETVKTCCLDKLILAKLHCFISIAMQALPFLTAYQTDKPMIPFLGGDMFRMIKGLMQRFIKADVLRDVAVYQLVTIDSSDKQNQCGYSKIDIGFAAEHEVKRLLNIKAISDKQVMEFRFECRAFLVSMVKKLVEKAPMKYPLVRHMSCLDPKQMATDKDGSISKLKKALQLLADIHRIKGGPASCDEILRQYREFLDTTVVENLGVYENFNVNEADNRVDVLLFNDMSNKTNYNVLWPFVKDILLLSHGQASVERGFSVNKEIEVENLHEQSLVAQRLICDHIDSVGGLHNVVVDKALLLSASTARQQYMAHLEDNRKQKLKADGHQKRKLILDEIDELKKKKRRTENEIKELLKSADEFALKAEATNKFTWITKSNSFRRTANDKTDQVNDIIFDLDTKVNSLKD